jgi:hypothetical protein
MRRGLAEDKHQRNVTPTSLPPTGLGSWFSFQQGGLGGIKPSSTIWDKNISADSDSIIFWEFNKRYM